MPNKRILGASLASLFALAVGCADDSPPADAGETDTDPQLPTGVAETETGAATDPGTTTGSTGAALETGTDAEGDTERPPGVEAARMLLEPLVAAQCERAFNCCSADEVAYDLGSAVSDAADCTLRSLDVLEAGGNPPFVQGSVIYLGNLLPFFAYGVDASAVVADEASIAACVTALAEEPCAALSESGADNCTPPKTVARLECDLSEMFVGQRGAGEACSSYNGLECGPGLICDFYGGGGGVCVESLADGDNCFNDYDCAGDLICDYGSGQCSQPADFGEPCAYSNPANPELGGETTRCRDDLVCDPLSETCGARACNFGEYCEDDAQCPAGLSCVTNRCDVLAVAGEQCWEHGDCASDYCVFVDFYSVCSERAAVGSGCINHDDCESGFCDPTDSECAAQAAVGDPCDVGLPPQQCGGGYCEVDACVAFLDLGDDCTMGGQCNYLADAVCVDGTCQAYPLSEGAPCNSNAECESNTCSGTCQPPPDVGDACVVGSCGAELYCDLAKGETSGTCQPRGSRGTPCTRDIQCWGSCEARFGETRCDGFGPGDVYCDGQ